MMIHLLYPLVVVLPRLCINNRDSTRIRMCNIRFYSKWLIGC